MKVKISKIDSYSSPNGSEFSADLQDLPGHPPVGFGDTKEEAVVNLFFQLLHPATTTEWIDHMNFESISVEYDEDYQEKSDGTD